MPRHAPTPSDSPPGFPETQFQPLDDESQHLFEALEILDERGPPRDGEYLVRWKGTDPDTGLAWDPTWEEKKGCTDGLIEEWKAKRKADPTIVGREGKRLEKKQKDREKERKGKRKGPAKGKANGKEKGKRKRGSEEPGSDREGKKGKTNGATSGRKRNLRSRAESVSTVASSTRSSYAPSASDALLRRSTRRAVSNTTTTPSTGTRLRRRSSLRAPDSSVEPEGPAGDSDSDSDFEVLSVHTSNPRAKPQPIVELPIRQLSPIQSASMRERAESPSSPSVRFAKQSTTIPPPPPDTAHTQTLAPAPAPPLSSKRVINISDTPPRDGPGPTTTQIKQMAKRTGSLPSKPGKKMRSVPQPSPSVLRHYATDVRDKGALETQTDSTGVSQVDPIASFSSPPEAARGNAQGGQREGGVQRETDAESGGELERGVEIEIEVEVAAAEVEESQAPARVEKRVIDGEEVWVAVTESMEREEEELAQAAAAAGGPAEEGDGQAHTVHGSTDEPADAEMGSAEETRPVVQVPELTDEDLALLEADVSVEYQTEIVVIDGPSQAVVSSEFACRWGACGQEVDSAVDLAKHLREHANVFDPLPQAVSQPRPNSQPTSQSQATSQPDDIPAPPPVAEPLPSQKPTIEIEIDSADRASPSTVDQIKAASAANLSDLTAKLDTAQSRVQSLVEENAWIRRMYDSASNSAAEEARRNDDLKKEMKILRQQLKLGLRQKDLHGEAIRSQWTAENAKLRAQVKILLDQSRLTDDAIREKAIKYPRVHERNKKLEQDLRESRQRNETLKERNEELRDQVEVLRARQMGVFQPGPGDEDESEGEETDAEEDRDSEIEGAEDPGALGYDVRHPHVTAWGNVHVPTPSGSGELATGPHKGFTGIAKGLEVVGAEPEALIPPVHVEVKEEEVVDVPLIYCRAQLPSKEMCTRAFDTAEELLRHAEEHIAAVLDIGSQG